MGAKIIMAVLAVIISTVAATAFFTGLDVFSALKTARGRKSKYFNIRHKPGHDTKFCRAHLVGKVGESKNKALYVVEIHPKDADKAYAWTVPEAELRGGHLLEKGRFYRYAFKEELYD